MAANNYAGDPWAVLFRRCARWGRSSSRHGSGPQDYQGDLLSAEIAGVPYHRDFVFEAQGYNLEGSEVLAAFGATRMRWFRLHHGFFRERDPLTAPLETNVEGIFLCGGATGPIDISESVVQATAAGMKAVLACAAGAAAL